MCDLTAKIEIKSLFSSYFITFIKKNLEFILFYTIFASKSFIT